MVSETHIRCKSIKTLNFQFALLQSFYWASYGALLGFPMIFFTERGFSYAQVGFLLGVVHLTSTLIQPIYPKCLKYLNAKFGVTIKSFLILLFITTFINSVSLLLTNPPYWGYILHYALFSVSVFAVSPLINSLAMNFLNEGVPLNFGLSRGIGSAFYATVILILGQLLVFWDTRLLLCANLLLIALAILSTLLIKDPCYYFDSENMPQLPDKVENDTTNSLSLLGFLKVNPVFTLLLFSSLFLYIGAYMIGGGFMPNIVERFGGNSADVGRILFTSAFFELPAMAIFSRINNKLNIRKMMIISAFGFFIKNLGTVIAASTTALMAVQLSQSVGYGFYYIGSVFFTNKEISPNNRVLAQGLLFSVSSLGNMIASITSGYLLEKSGVPSIFSVSLINTTLGVILTIGMVYLSIRREKEAALASATQQ